MIRRVHSETDSPVLREIVLVTLNSIAPELVRPMNILAPTQHEIFLSPFFK